MIYKILFMINMLLVTILLITSNSRAEFITNEPEVNWEDPNLRLDNGELPCYDDETGENE